MKLSSNEIAIALEIEHKKILRDIRKYISKCSDAENHFIKSTYIDCQNKKRPCYFIDSIGVKIIIDNKYKTPKLYNLIKLYNDTFDENAETIILSDRFENSFINDLEEFLNNFGIHGKRQFICGNYFIDFYIEELNIAIEYDEEQHKYSQAYDIERQKYISDKLNCDFIRCDFKTSNVNNIAKVFKYILNQKER